MKYIILISLSILVLFNGCTIRQYKNKDQIQTTTEVKNFNKAHKFSYYVDVNAIRIFRTRGINDTEVYINEYLTSIKKVFNDNTLSFYYEKDKEKANFIINIKEQIYSSALGQEYLTGLSLGLIPSWGTRPNQYIFEFIDTHYKKSHIYRIDDTRYNHLTLFPIFWLTFLLPDKLDMFEKSLDNFLHSYIKPTNKS